MRFIDAEGARGSSGAPRTSLVPVSNAPGLRETKRVGELARVGGVTEGGNEPRFVEAPDSRFAGFDNPGAGCRPGDVEGDEANGPSLVSQHVHDVEAIEAEPRQRLKEPRDVAAAPARLQPTNVAAMRAAESPF